MVDLIFRAHEQGQRYGLPASYLNVCGVDSQGTIGTNEARFVDGKLMLVSRWEAHADKRERLSEKARHFAPTYCLHTYTNVWQERLWQKVEHAVPNMMGLEASKVFKCPFCETDYTLRLHCNTTGGMTVVMDIWKNYGRRDDDVLAHEQMFHRNPTSYINAEAVLRGDQRADVGSLVPLAPKRIARFKRGVNYYSHEES